MLEVCGSCIRKLSGATIFVLFFMNAAVSGPFEDAIAAKDRGDYSTAMKLHWPNREMLLRSST
jgi:hypothetical protein